MDEHSSLSGYGLSLIVFSACIFYVALVMTSLKLAIHCGLSKSSIAEDLCGLGAIVTCAGMLATIILGVLRGIGRTSEEGGIDYDALGKIQLAVQVLYITSAAWVKLSILFLYRQVFQHMRTIITITIAVIVVITVVFIFVAIFQCHPIGRFWFELKATQGACIYQLIFWCDVAVVFLLSNIWITALPVRPILGLHVKGRLRTGILLLLCSTGLLTCSMATIRLAYIVKLYRGNDPTRDIVPIYFCSIAEICVALVSLSIPSLRLAARRKWASPAPC